MAVTPEKTAATPADRAGRSNGTFWHQTLDFTSRFTVQIALLLLIIVFSLLSDRFFTYRNWLNIIEQSSIIAIVAIGATFVIITAGIDLSVGSVVALSGILSSGVIVNSGLPWWLGLLVGLLVGGVVGLFNGLSITGLGLSAFITTLATMAMGRGLTLAYSNGKTIFGMPDPYNFLGGGDVFGIPMSVILTIVAFIIAHLILSKTIFGHQIYAIGGNREAARLAGIRVKRIELIVYIIAGLLSGFAGLLLTGRLTAALPTSATGLELNVIAAVVIGGASLFGGRGSMIGTFFGVLTIGVLSNGLDLLNVSPFWVQFIQGAVIFLAVLIDALGQKRRNANT
ncbi:MAG TPA: ABC transporter permease [Ktedonobacteraceae bacterium]|jgi:ribose transport system permease protein|nr:ABC transporter permease [Ktedonobacteraceae bacterium]